MLTRLVDVAKEAGVSRVAAGKVLLGTGGDRVKTNVETAKRIRAAAKKLNYQPNRSAQRLRGKTVGLIGAMMAVHAPPSELARLVAVERLAANSGQQVIFSTLPGKGGLPAINKQVLNLRSQGCSNVVFLSGGIPLKGKNEIPTHSVFCGIPKVIGDAPGVVFDFSPGINAAIKRFESQGRMRIGLALETGVMEKGHFDHYAEHWHHATREAASNYQGLSVFSVNLKVASDCRIPSIEESRKAIDFLVTQNKVDAILTTSDNVAARLLQALMQEGIRVPDDVAVCGADNVDISELTAPALSTIGICPQEVVAAQFSLLSEDSTETQKTVSSKLIIRDSA